MLIIGRKGALLLGALASRSTTTTQVVVGRGPWDREGRQLRQGRALLEVDPSRYGARGCAGTSTDDVVAGCGELPRSVVADQVWVV